MKNYATYGVGKYNTAKYNTIENIITVELDITYTQTLVELGGSKNTPIITLYKYKPTVEIERFTPTQVVDTNTPDIDGLINNPVGITEESRILTTTFLHSPTHVILEDNNIKINIGKINIMGVVGPIKFNNLITKVVPIITGEKQKPKILV